MNTIEYFRKNMKDFFKNKINLIFYSHPTFESIISELQSIIDELCIRDEEECIMVIDYNNQISFKYTNLLGVSYIFNILFDNDNNFTCIIKKEKPITMGGKVSTNILEEQFNYNPLTNEVYIYKYDVSIENTYPNDLTLHKLIFAEKKVYSTDGIMVERDIRELPIFPFDQTIKDINVPSAVSVAHYCFEKNDEYVSRLYLKRLYLDVSYIHYINFRDNTEYRGYIKLNPDCISELMLDSKGNILSENYYINPLTIEEIEILINKESNPNRRQGLEKLSIGREFYTYRANNSEIYVCKGFDSEDKFQKKLKF